MRAYLGGPMRKLHHLGFAEFDRVAALLRAHGYVIINPAEHDRSLGFDETTDSVEDFDVDAALRWDLRAISRCDAVIFLHAWELSEGCGIEYAHARKKGIPVYRFVDCNHGEFRLDLVEAAA